jgi:DNA-binding transcriptional LysR family regulator
VERHAIGEVVTSFALEDANQALAQSRGPLPTDRQMTSSADGWFGVELRHLTALAAVAREGSFRGAAESLGYAQSAVSQQIAQLELLVGVRLVERSRGCKMIRVTARGEVLVDHAESVLARMQAARADLTGQCEGRGRGALKVGVFPGVSVGLLSHVLRDFASARPAERVEPIESGDEAALFLLVEQGEADLAFCELPLRPGAFASRAVLRDPPILLASLDSDLAGRTKPPTVGELVQMPLVMLDGVRWTATLETWFREQGAAPNVVLRTPNEATLKAFVAAGLGAAVVPSLGVRDDDPTIHAIGLDGIVPDRYLALFSHSEGRHDGALEAFCQTTIEAAARLNGGDEPPLHLVAA